MGSPRARATGRCARCAVRAEHCICSFMAQPVVSRARVVIVRHAREVWRPTNTARIAVEAIAGARLVTYGELDTPGFDAAALLDALPGPHWLLYPPDPGGETVPLGAPPPGAIIAIDGTWTQTQRFVRRHPRLAALPRCALPEALAPADDPLDEALDGVLADAPSGVLADAVRARDTSFRIRHARAPDRRLTAEAIASYLALWESADAGLAMMRIHRAFVAATFAGRGDPVPPGWVEA